MKNVSIEQVMTGAILAADLKTVSGSLILGQGAKLTDSMIARLKKMGIGMVSVEIDNPEELLREKEALLTALNVRFKGTEEDVYLQALKAIAEEHIQIM